MGICSMEFHVLEVPGFHRDINQNAINSPGFLCSNFACKQPRKADDMSDGFDCVE